MLWDYLRRGVKAGLVAGLAFGLFVAVVANPIVAFADETNHAAGGSDHVTGGSGHAEGESGHAHTHESEDHGDAGGHHDATVSAAVNRTVSVISGGLWALLLGAVVFGVVFYFLEPAIPGTGATKSYVLGIAGFVSVSGAPWLVLPPAAPGAQQSLAVGTRLPLYAGTMIVGALCCLLAGYVYRRLARSTGVTVAAAASLLPFGLLVVLAAFAPTNAVEGALSPALRNGVTGTIVFGQLLLWLLLATTHAQFTATEDGGDDLAPTDLGPATPAD